MTLGDDDEEDGMEDCVLLDLVSPGPAQVAEVGERVRVQPRREPGVQQGGENSELAQLLISQLAKSNEVIASAMKDNNKEKEVMVSAINSLLSASQAGKRKARGEESMEEEEPVVREGTYTLRDDNNTVLNRDLRGLLCKQANSSDPETWWSNEDFPKVSRPILGEGLCIGHLGPDFVHPETIIKMHDRSK